MRCDYCKEKIQLVTGDTIYPRRPDLHHKLFWLCRPCDAYVGCHESGKGTTPLGRIANAELRQAKMAVHAIFDPLWKEGQVKRNEAYWWLSRQMGMTKKECHIGWFDLEQCRKAIAICQTAEPPVPRTVEIDAAFERAIS